MKALILVGLGGFIGSVARYALGNLVLQLAPQARFPWSTFAVNVLGCLVVGLLAGWTDRYPVLGTDVRLFVFTGLLGGFTTFSAFGLDALSLLRRGEPLLAAIYTGASVGLGLFAAWLGFAMVTAWLR